MEADLKAAQDKLLQKREQAQTETHTRSIENTDFQAIADRCMAMARERNIHVVETPQREYGQEQEKKEDPDALPRYIGIPKMYLNCTFETFQGNEKLIADLKAMATTEDSLILRGNTGCGKTHLAVAMLQMGLDWNDRFITVPDLLLKIRGSFNGSGESEEDVIDRYAGARVLVLDDLGAEKTSEFAVTTLYIILDRRIRECLKTIITTNLLQSEIEATFGARIASRMSAMENIKINMPDYRKKRG